MKILSSFANLSIEDLKNDKEYFEGVFAQLEEILFENFSQLIKNKRKDHFKAYFAKVSNEDEKTLKIFGIVNKASFTRIHEGRAIDFLTGGIGMIKNMLKKASKIEDLEEKVENGFQSMIDIFAATEEIEPKGMFIMIHFSEEKKIVISICKNKNRIPEVLKNVSTEDLFNGIKML